MRVVRVVAAVIERDGRVLAAQRPPGHVYAGLWEFPGGKVEQGESDEAALARELGEELGVEVAVGTYLGTGEDVIGDKRIVLVGYAARIVACEPVASEHAHLAWEDDAGLGALSWCPADIPIVEAWLRRV